jgi:hypothetical protein
MWCVLYHEVRLLDSILILCFVDRASQINRVKKNQFDAQLILSIFPQDNRQSTKKNNKYQLLYTYSYTS